MEETNYHRKPLLGIELKNSEGIGPKYHKSDTPDDAVKEHIRDAELSLSTITEEENGLSDAPKRKSYYQKLKVFDKQQLQYPNQLKDMILRPLMFLSFPVISYAGFSYGSSLVWFNVLNGTASLILSEKPYGFSSSIVGLAYISPFIGMILG